LNYIRAKLYQRRKMDR